MTAALRLAAVRALESLPVRPDAVILDGKHDYLGSPWRVRTVIKGDQSCVAVAAASVIAKVRRDRMMADLAEQGGGIEDFAFAANAGYPRPCTGRRWRSWGPPRTTGSRGRTSTRCPAGGTSKRCGAARRAWSWKTEANSGSISDRVHVPPAGTFRTGV